MNLNRLGFVVHRVMLVFFFICIRGICILSCGFNDDQSDVCFWARYIDIYLNGVIARSNNRYLLGLRAFLASQVCV